ncbi:hypothetical protein INT45_013049 [Circinella minor]|uniref:Uncharacterized protein n=1 Tax=Circinella minor TaxID=1195481 RepID=A0A8H7S2B9_9FUNG|nr:hypothetical protein INT45_013049 [Circinella minor]
MGLLRFSRKDKPSTDLPNTPTSTPKKRVEISSTDTISGNQHYKLHNQKEKKKNKRQQKSISRDFFSSSSFKAIIGERGSLMDDILNELRPEDILEEEAESDGVMMSVPRTSTSVSTMTFNSTTAPTSIANTTKIPTPIATKSAVLPRQSISSKGSNNYKGFLAQKYMEASNRRYRQSQSQQQQRRPTSSESSNNRITRSSFATTMKRADLCCETDQKCRKHKANNKQQYNLQSDILPVAAQQQQKDEASRRSRSVPVGHQIPVINEPADSESSALPQRQQQLLHNSATQKRDLLHPGRTLQMHLPPTPPPDAEDEVEKTINVPSFQHRRGCDKGTMTTEPYWGNHHHHYLHHNNCHHHHYYHDDHSHINKNNYHMCSHKQEQHHHHCHNNPIYNPCQHHPHHHNISHPTTAKNNNNNNNNNIHHQQYPYQSHPNHHNHNLDHHHNNSNSNNTNHHCHHHNGYETHVHHPQHHRCCVPLPQQTHRHFHCFCTSPPIVYAQPSLCHHYNHHCSNHQCDVRQSTPDVVLPSQSVPSPRTSKGKDRAVRSSKYYNNAGHCCNNNNNNNDNKENAI